MRSKEESAITLVQNLMFNHQTMEWESDPIKTVGWQYFSLFLEVRGYGGEDHSIEVIRQISPVLEGNEWYDCGGVWGAHNAFHDLVISASDAMPGDFKRAYSGRCIGMRARVRVVASETTAQNKLKFSAKIQLW